VTSGRSLAKSSSRLRSQQRLLPSRVRTDAMAVRAHHFAFPDFRQNRLVPNTGVSHSGYVCDLVRPRKVIEIHDVIREGLPAILAWTILDFSNKCAEFYPAFRRVCFRSANVVRLITFVMLLDRDAFAKLAHRIAATSFPTKERDRVDCLAATACLLPSAKRSGNQSERFVVSDCDLLGGREVSLARHYFYFSCAAYNSSSRLSRVSASMFIQRDASVKA